MNRDFYVPGSGIRVAWGSADAIAQASRQELAGYEALTIGKLEQAQACFDFAVNLDPLCAFRVSEACVQSGSYGLAQDINGSLVEKFLARPSLGSPVERLRGVIDCLTLALVNLTTAQLLQKGPSNWDSLSKSPRAAERLVSDKLSYLDLIFSHMEGSYKSCPIITLKLVLLLAKLDLLTEQRHQVALRTLFQSRESTFEGKIFQPQTFDCISTLQADILSAIAMQQKSGSSFDSLGLVEDSHRYSDNQIYIPLTAGLTPPSKKRWLRLRSPFPHQTS